MGNHFHDNEVVLAQFNRLMQELLRASMTRNTFQPWEIDLLLDIDMCNLPPAARKDVLRRYQKAVQRSMEKTAGMPMKLSEYLEALRQKRTAANPEADLVAEPQL